MKEVKSFWENKAKDDTLTEAQVTHKDVWQRWLEIEHLKKLLKKDERVVDIGCGTGYATKILAHSVAELTGVDYSDAMVERAQSDNHLPSNVNFRVGDVLGLSRESFGIYDTAITVRCLINLPDWATQKKAILNIASLLEPGGRFIFIEGSAEGRTNLDQFRESVGLERMPTVWHNKDFHRDDMLEFISDAFEIEQEIHFGTYDYIARVVHPLTVAPESPDYNAKINEVAARLALIGQNHRDISRTLFLVMRKK